MQNSISLIFYILLPGFIVFICAKNKHVIIKVYTINESNKKELNETNKWKKK